MDTPETTDSDEEYWADNSWDRVVNETISECITPQIDVFSR